VHFDRRLALAVMSDPEGGSGLDAFFVQYAQQLPANGHAPGGSGGYVSSALAADDQVRGGVVASAPVIIVAFVQFHQHSAYLGAALRKAAVDRAQVYSGETPPAGSGQQAK